MKNLAFVALVVAAAGCGDSKSFTVKGEVTVGGKPAKVTGCAHVKSKDVGRQTEFTLDTGHTIYWEIPNPIVRKDGKELEVECRDGDLEAEGGKGKWRTTCDHPDGEIKLDLDYDC